MKIELTTYYGLPALADEHGNYLTVNGDVAFYTTQEAAERAKRIFELKDEHPNMPDEWYERNADKGVTAPSVTDIPGHVIELSWSHFLDAEAESVSVPATCDDCHEPFDAYRRPIHHRRAVTCSNCREGLRAWLNGLEPPKGKPRMVYDEPPYESPKMNAMAKWHNRNTSIDASEE